MAVRTALWSEKLFSTEKNVAELERLDIDPQSMSGRMFLSICDGMGRAADRIQRLGYSINSSSVAVVHQFSDGDVERIRLNELGELQARATEYEAAIGAYAALAMQRERFVQLAERAQARAAEKREAATPSATVVRPGRPGPRTRARRAQQGGQL
jgi:hypothetical protein